MQLKLHLLEIVVCLQQKLKLILFLLLHNSSNIKPTVTKLVVQIFLEAYLTVWKLCDWNDSGFVISKFLNK